MKAAVTGTFPSVQSKAGMLNLLTDSYTLSCMSVVRTWLYITTISLSLVLFRN